MTWIDAILLFLILVNLWWSYMITMWIGKQEDKPSPLMRDYGN